LALLTLIVASGTHSVSAGRVQESSEDKSKAVFAQVCGRCHPIERVTAMRRTRPQWEEAIEAMINARGAKVTDEEYETVLGYLVKEHGRVDINRARPNDIVEVLGIADAVADKIVQYRGEHGPFEDFDALVKVPGIDREQLEKKRDAITF
jgi:competence ComEA-like helix-hairpin-helix protein